ncbi:MAG: glycosyltransferase [Lentisphaeria bacterium]|nr:glycosyltransferase [Lentisphaeria bacterium]
MRDVAGAKDGGASSKYTVSLVIYKSTLSGIMPVVSGVLASECTKFYIIDNGNDPRLAADIAALDSEKICYVAQENRGFGAGHNVALRDSISAGVPFHIIVNPDISFEPGTLEKIIAFMDNTPDAGLVMPETLNPDGSLQYNCKFVPSPADLIFKRFLPGFLKRRRMAHFMMMDYDHESVLAVPYLCGCFMAFRNEILKRTGLFDERFFLYPEDIDITRRIWHAGFRALYFPGASVIHAHAQASYKSMKMLWCHICNMIRYFNKWGWIWDPLRRELNRKIKDANAGKKIRKQYDHDTDIACDI